MVVPEVVYFAWQDQASCNSRDEWHSAATVIITAIRNQPFHVDQRQMPLWQYRFPARMGRQCAGHPGARMRLLVLRQARWRLDIQPEFNAGGEHSRGSTRVEVRVRNA